MHSSQGISIGYTLRCKKRRRRTKVYNRLVPWLTIKGSTANYLPPSPSYCRCLNHARQVVDAILIP